MPGVGPGRLEPSLSNRRRIAGLPALSSKTFPTQPPSGPYKSTRPRPLRILSSLRLLRFNEAAQLTVATLAGTLQSHPPPPTPHGGERRESAEARVGRLPRRSPRLPLRPRAPREARPLLAVGRCRRRTRPQFPVGFRPDRSAPAHLPRRGSAGTSAVLRHPSISAFFSFRVRLCYFQVSSNLITTGNFRS
jgi:hypothetical protein